MASPGVPRIAHRMLDLWFVPGQHCFPIGFPLDTYALAETRLWRATRILALPCLGLLHCFRSGVSLAVNSRGGTQ